MMRANSLPSFFIALAMFLATIPAQAEPLPDGVAQNLVLAPTSANQRNSEGDFINLKDGRILFIYSHFTGGVHDDSPAYLASRVSSDSGKTWSDHDEMVIDSKAHGVANIMSVSLLRLKDDRIALFYLVKRNDADCAMVMRTSADEAKTWSGPTVCTGEQGYFLVDNGRAVRLKSGRIIVPAARRDPPQTAGAFRRGIAMCVISDDNGATWNRSKTALEAPANSHSGFQHPLVVELDAGRLMMLVCMHLRPPFRSYSTDGGDTWSAVEPTDLVSPIAPASIKRIPTTGDLLLVWNDHTSIAPALKNSRTPLTVAISTDQGKTWQHRKNLYSDPAGFYCCTAIDFLGDRVLLAHCATEGGKKPGMGRTVITSFDVGWLYR